MKSVYMNEKFLTRGDIAKKLKVTPRTLKNWQASGLLPVYKLPGTRTVRYKESEVNEAFSKVGKKENNNG